MAEMRGLLSLPEDLIEAIIYWSWSTRELARLAASQRQRLCPIVRRLLRDRSHPIWRKLCANEGGGTVFQHVADYSSLYFRLRKLTPPPIRTIDRLEFILKVHMLVADAVGGESEELVFSELLHGKDATCSSFDGLDEGLGIEYGFKWPCHAAAKLLTHLGPAEGAVACFQLEATNASKDDFPSAADRARWTVEQMVRRAGRRTWKLSLHCFNPANQSVYHLLDDAPPFPDYSDCGGTRGWSTQDLTFAHQPLRFVVSDAPGPMVNGADGQYRMVDGFWHAHAKLVPPTAPIGKGNGAALTSAPPWQLHFNVAEEDVEEREWTAQPSELVLTALENVQWV
eukprot:jgi/Chrpa1/14030/Chrysochromulina_OHIO_Genome00000104-RA